MSEETEKEGCCGSILFVDVAVMAFARGAERQVAVMAVGRGAESQVAVMAQMFWSRENEWSFPRKKIGQRSIGHDDVIIVDGVMHIKCRPK